MIAGLIKNVAKTFANPGSVIEKALDAVLPKQLEWVGDIASLATNIKSGRWFAALGDVADLKQNIKDGDFSPEKLLAGLKKLLPRGSHKLLDKITHPDPPPVRCSHSRSGRPPSVSGCAGASTAQVSSSGSRSSPQVSSGNGGSTHQVSPGNVGSTSRVSPSNGESTDGMKLVANMSDKEVMAAIRSGNIPPEIRKDPDAMRELQRRMHEISEMNALLTALIKALHDMQMAIIQNIRV